MRTPAGPSENLDAATGFPLLWCYFTYEPARYRERPGNALRRALCFVGLEQRSTVGIIWCRSKPAQAHD
jgi:hypothetical protein